MPTIEQLQAEIDELKAQIAAKPSSWGANLRTVVDYVTDNKVKLVGLVMAAAALYVSVHNYLTKTDHEAVMQISKEAAHDEVKAKLPAAVDAKVAAAVDARPVPLPVIHEVPFAPGSTKTNEDKK